MSAGKVWLVGAGPGDAGLLTLKAARALERAEVVVYDSLVGQAVLAMLPTEAQAIDVGKRSGNHPVPQEQINQLLIDHAQAGKRVVRLKGGDPFLFGRGGEELEALLQAGVAAEVVPGVTSAIAVPAYAGIPVTHRDHASSLHVVTAHGKRGSDTGLDYAMLAGLPGTLVILMGVSRLQEICAGLVAAGKPAGTPAVLIASGTTAHQRSIAGTLDTLPGLVSAAGMGAPALIVVGAAAALAGQLDWRAGLPLTGRRVVVTRPRSRAGSLGDLLRAEGAEVLELPCIQTRALPEPLPKLRGYDWIAFTSPAGVEHIFEKLAAENRDIRELKSTRIAAVGPATAEELRRRGLRVELVPDKFEVSSLGGLEGRVLAVQAQEPAGELPGDRLAVYETLRCAPVFAPEDVDYLAFASASAVAAFQQACPDVRAVAACIGPTTAKAAQRAGYPVLIAKEATIASLVECIKEDSICR